MALSRVLPQVVADPVILSVFSSAMDTIILIYCVVVAAVSDSIATVLPVDAADRALECPSNFSMKEARAPAMWLPGGTAVMGGDILWTRAAECAEPKAYLRPLASLNYCLSAL